MKFGIVIFPTKKLQDLANSYRKRYDTHYALIPPHLTLRSGFEATEEQITELTKKLEEIAGNYEPFRLRVYRVSSFHPVNNVIYLKAEVTEQLEGLHNEFLKSFDDGQPEYAFVPHITIGQNLSDAEHSDVYGSLKMLDIDHEETVDRFHLLYQLESGQWTVYETFRLGKDNQN